MKYVENSPIEVDRVVAEERATMLKQRREEARRRLDEERKRRMETQEKDASEEISPEEYVPFDQTPSPPAKEETTSEDPESK